MKSHRKTVERLHLMLTMSRRDPVLKELQDQTEPESSNSAAAAVQSTRLATHRARPQNPAPRLSSAQLGGRYLLTQTLPAFYLANKVSSEEQRAFPSMFREHTTSLQH